MKFDPGKCPVCGGAICSQVPINCSENCSRYTNNLHHVRNMSPECLQNLLPVCYCSKSDILKAFWKEYPEYEKCHDIEQYLILRSFGYNDQLIYKMLPEDLFEI